MNCSVQLNALGLAKVHFLDYRDSGMPGSPDNNHPNALVQAPVEEVAKKIALLMRRLQTPGGGYI